jgi:hypothetical protein
MKIIRKVSRGFRYYPEDLDRIDKLLEPRETKTEFIETALQHEFERREGRGKARPMTSLSEMV